MLNYSWFQSFVSDPVKRDPILDQFSMITRPYTRPNGLKTIPSTKPNGLKTIPFTTTNDLKTIPFPAAHTRIANIWEYLPGVSIYYLIVVVFLIVPDSLVSRVIMLNLNILDELARHLDKPISHDGILSCWKQLASYFNMTEDVYQKVNRSGNCGSTEQMFDWFRATRPELTVREIKGVLEKIGRQDLVDIIGSKLQGSHTNG